MRLVFAALRRIVLFASSFAVCGAAHALLLTGPTNDLSGSGDIATPGLTQSWLFEANPAGGFVTIVGTSSSSLHLEEDIIDPLGDVIGSATSALTGQVVTLFEVPLTMSGLYTIVVSGRDNTIGTYDLHATGVEGASIHALVVPEPAPLALVAAALVAGIAWRAGRQRE